MQIENCKLQIESRRAARRGMTLVELLVVISILVILMGVASQMMNLSVDDRRTREAARAVNVYLSSARNRAIQTGRPCGVLLRTLRGQSGAVVDLQQAEVPPPYAGDTLDAVAQLQIEEITMEGLSRRAIVKWNTKKSSIGDPSLIKQGDLVQFNHQGPLYTIDDRVEGYRLTLSIDLSQGQILPWPEGNNAGWSAPVPYQIFRLPRKSAVTPLQLPTRAVIDLKWSGTDDHFIGAGTDSPVCIMFSPNGSLGQIYHHGEVHPGAEPVFLLVGRQDRVEYGPLTSGTPLLEELPNWADPENLWIRINPQTGRVTTAENGYIDPAKVDWTDPQSWPTHIRAAREIAREGQSMGGR